MQNSSLFSSNSKLSLPRFLKTSTRMWTVGLMRSDSQIPLLCPSSSVNTLELNFEAGREKKMEFSLFKCVKQSTSVGPGLHMLEDHRSHIRHRKKKYIKSIQVAPCLGPSAQLWHSTDSFLRHLLSPYLILRVCVYLYVLKI